MTAVAITALAVLTVLVVMVAIVSCIVPPLPGPAVGYLALVTYELMPGVDGFSAWTYVFWGVVVAGVTAADFLFPPVVTRKFGGTRGGVWGGAFGALGGVFFAPWGILLGPLVGAIAGDLLGGNRIRAALKSGAGSFAGFLVATFVKVAVCIGIGAVVVGRGLAEVLWP